mmetsp:Transcript_20275/g.24224  ORF Transcript_20275/g.24224 Transcript_20275/m.24224 type:complete len:544 (-) Transcript_20275:126-1757(-)|eukprot:CAMPEP_0197846664 /NCGR_PEP_ID=MMETSP1438-20131217/3994_1 /TAXON_ID=1461541 /ORGANISM="Pterosperma sp., Strain CCMP1384" /LENGTH=543 /DNA_ID=CAMNT_0043458385 /DNA_START=68 /DNA_END=1699 /DNA_ORIENTATION=+
MSDPVAPGTPPVDVAMADGETPQLSKAQLKKQAAKAEKEAKKAAKAAALAAAEAERKAKEDNDPLKDNYGEADLICSKVITDRKWTRVNELTDQLVGESVLVRARVHNVRAQGKGCFMVLRQQSSTVQVCMFVNDTTVSKGMVKFCAGLSKETIIDVEGQVTKPQAPLKDCTQQIEIEARKVYLISKAATPLPFQISDASRSEKDFETNPEAVRVGQDTRLDNRVIDLRTPANSAIFRLQSGVCQLFRNALLAQDFMEIHSPKTLGGTSEGGANVFKFDYFGSPGCLAQSPQLYKQMAICADFERVFEIGPVFRAENSYTHRHLCEFVGLDMEMMIHEHYFEVMDVLDKLFVSIFKGLYGQHKDLLDVVCEQYPAEPFQFLEPSLKLTFEEGIKMLHDAGYTDVDPLDDLSTEIERVLGRLVKEKYHTDFYMLHRYPLAVRPFYTMPAPDNENYSNSFDIFMRGEEIISGAQRVHVPEMLKERAIQCEIDPETIAGYIDSFKYGAVPHGGCGVGLERVVMLFCGLNNIRKTSLFPRDPKRLTP